MEDRVRRRGVRAVALVVALAMASACGGGEGEAGTEASPDAGTDTATRASASAGAPADTAPWTPELAGELREMGRVDQTVREGIGPEALADTAFMGRMVRADSAHSRRLRELVGRHGWPRSSEVGEEAAEAAFLVVQHSPFEAWQREMLPHVEAAVRAGELDPQDFALLFDRVQVKQGRPQRYGTQLRSGSDGRLYLEPLEDTVAVDSLRSELGLPPLDAYFDLIEESMGMTVAREGIGS